MSFIIIGHLTEFNTIVLHNGTDRFANDIAKQSTSARLNIIELADGTLYDADGNGKATVLPQKITSNHLLRFSSHADLLTAVSQIAQQAGESGNATALDIAGNTVSCIARLESVVTTYRTGANLLNLTITLQPTGEWS